MRGWQVVHHLFPAISHTHYPAIAPIVMQTCKEFGVPYKVYPTVCNPIHPSQKPPNTDSVLFLATARRYQSLTRHGYISHAVHAEYRDINAMFRGVQ